MKISKDKLLKFVKKASMNGSIETIYIDFLEDGLECKVRNINNVCVTNVKLEMELSESDRLERVYIKNTHKFMNILKTFGDELDLTKDGYTLKIKDDNRRAKIILASDRIVDNVFDRELPDIPIARKIYIPYELLTKTVSDMKLSNNMRIKIDINNDVGSLTVGAENEDMFTNTFSVDVGESTTVSIGDYIVSLVESLDKNTSVEFSVGTNVPLVINEVTDDIKYTCIIAPFVGD